MTTLAGGRPQDQHYFETFSDCLDILIRRGTTRAALLGLAIAADFTGFIYTAPADDFPLENDPDRLEKTILNSADDDHQAGDTSATTAAATATTSA